MRLAITYDISDDATRRDVYRTLESYGAWKQYSVFELEITKTERAELEDKLEDYLDPGDRIRIYTLCQSCTDNIQNLGPSQDEDDDLQTNIV